VDGLLDYISGKVDTGMRGVNGVGIVMRSIIGIERVGSG